jgi:hypothetical protein
MSAIAENEIGRAPGDNSRCLLAWGVLTHDLWVLANKLREQRKIRQQKLGQVT